MTLVSLRSKEIYPQSEEVFLQINEEGALVFQAFYFYFYYSSEIFSIYLFFIKTNTVY